MTNASWALTVYVTCYSDSFAD